MCTLRKRARKLKNITSLHFMTSFDSFAHGAKLEHIQMTYTRYFWSMLLYKTTIKVKLGLHCSACSYLHLPSCYSITRIVW